MPKAKKVLLTEKREPRKSLGLAINMELALRTQNQIQNHFITHVPENLTGFNTWLELDPRISQIRTKFQNKSLDPLREFEVTEINLLHGGKTCKN